MEPDLGSLVQGLASTLRPSGTAILTAANRLSLFELLAYPLALRPRKAFRRLGNPIPIPISRKGQGAQYVVPSMFYTPAEFLSSFNRYFDVKSLRSFQALTPPWNMVDWAARFRPAVEILEAVEDVLGSKPVFRNLGAIYLTTLLRRDA